MNKETINNQPVEFSSQPRLHIHEKWSNQVDETTSMVKFSLWKAYHSQIIGHRDEVVDGFAEGKDFAWSEVEYEGLKEQKDPNIEGFWNIVSRAMPGLHTEQERLHLIEQGGIEKVHDFLNHFRDSGVAISLSRIVNDENDFLSPPEELAA